MAFDKINPETLPKLSANPTVDRINTILNEANTYNKAHKEWEAESKLRRDNNQEVNPEPPVPESYPAALVLEKERINYTNTVREILGDISSAINYKAELLGYPDTEEKREEAAGKLSRSKNRIDILIDELGNYSGADVDPPEMVKIIRASALIHAASFSTTDDILGKTIEACPEALHLVDKDGKFSRPFLDNLSQHSPYYYQNSNLVPILNAFVSENSPLSPADREKAKYYQTELRGYHLFSVLKNKHQDEIRQISLNSLLQLLDINLSSEVLSRVSDPNNYSFVFHSADTIPLVLARISNEAGVSPEDKQKLRTEVVGYIKAMEVDSSERESYQKVDMYGTLRLSQSAMDRKVAAAEAAAEIIGTEFPMIELAGERHPPSDDPVINELFNIFCPSIYGRTFGSTLEPVLVVMRRQGEAVYRSIEKRKEEKRITAQRIIKEQEEEERKARIAEHQETKRKVEVFNSSKIRNIFNSIDSSQPNYTASVREALSQADIDDSSREFILKVLENIDSISEKHVKRKDTVVPGKKGILGIGATPDKIETHVSVDKQKIKIELDPLNKKISDGYALSADEQAKKLALEHFTKFPDGEFIVS